MEPKNPKLVNKKDPLLNDFLSLRTKKTFIEGYFMLFRKIKLWLFHI